MQKIESINNSKILEIAKLQNKKERTIQKKFIVEGYHLVEEANKHGLLELILSINEDDFKIYPDGYLVNEKIINKLSTTVTKQGIIGIVKMPEFNKNLKDLKHLVLLDNINDPGNLGTIIRTSAALNIDAVIISNDTVDIYNEKVIRATQGSIFKIPVIKKDLIETINKLKNNQFKVYATSLNTNNLINNLDVPLKFAVVFGNEANGVRQEVFNEVDNLFKIPMYNDVESLNVGIACAITIYHFMNK